VLHREAPPLFQEAGGTDEQTVLRNANAILGLHVVRHAPAGLAAGEYLRAHEIAMALELELESLLRNRFPQDLIEPVPKGEFGGDIQRVQGPAGQFLGTILWVSKRTKAWNDIWLTKLRDDQRTAKAEIALIVPPCCLKASKRSTSSTAFG
jgi:hypothetical protein